jgi:hypothetical protein
VATPESGQPVREQPPLLSVVNHPEWGELTRFECGWVANLSDPLPPSDWDDLRADAGDTPICLVRWGPPPVSDETWYAAHIDHHLREAVLLSLKAYGPDMKPNAVRWVIYALAEALGLPTNVADPMLVEIEAYAQAARRESERRRRESDR